MNVGRERFRIPEPERRGLAAGAGLELDSVLTVTDDDVEIAAEAFVMHSWLGMHSSESVLSIRRCPSP